MSSDEIDRFWRQSFDYVATKLGRDDFSLMTTSKGHAMQVQGYSIVMHDSLDELVECAKRVLQPNLSGFERTIYQLGFVSEDEFHKMVSSVRMDTFERSGRFREWKNFDGSKRGLVAVIAANGVE